jgi:hypothetical protein
VAGAVVISAATTTVTIIIIAAAEPATIAIAISSVCHKVNSPIFVAIIMRSPIESGPKGGIVGVGVVTITITPQPHRIKSITQAITQPCSLQNVSQER